MLTKVLKNDANVDLICPSEYAVEKLMRAEKLYSFQEVTQSIQSDLDKYNIELNNLGNVQPGIKKAIDVSFSKIPVGNTTQNMNDYILPYMWGTLGIMYNVKYVTEEDLAEGWGLAWNKANNPLLENMILVKDSVRDVYAAGILYMKQYGLLPPEYQNRSNVELINCTDDILIKMVEEVLTDQRKHISGYEVDFGKDDMLNEIAYVDLSWSGDAMWAISESFDENLGIYTLDYFVPEIGGNIWYDGWVVPKTAKNKLAAMMFIDYMAIPEHAILNSEEIGYTSAVDKALMQADSKVLDILTENGYEDTAEYFADERRYPLIEDPEVFASLGVMQDYGSRNEIVVQMWERVKAGGSISLDLVWITLGIVGAGVLVACLYFAKEGLKRRPKIVKDKTNVQNA